jgi:hypothetical protein
MPIEELKKAVLKKKASCMMVFASLRSTGMGGVVVYYTLISFNACSIGPTTLSLLGTDVEREL